MISVVIGKVLVGRLLKASWHGYGLSNSSMHVGRMQAGGSLMFEAVKL